MNQKIIFCITFLVIFWCDISISSAAIENNVGDFDDINKTLTIYDNESMVLTVRLISAVPDFCTFTEVFEVSNFEAYIPDNKNDFTARTVTVVGSGDVTEIEWYIEQNVLYSVNVTDYGIEQVEEIIYNNKTGKNETILVNRTVIIGYHDETRYRNIWVDYQPYGKVMLKDQVQRIKVIYHKIPELGPFQIQTVPIFRGVECSELTWWNESWTWRRFITYNQSAINGIHPNIPLQFYFNFGGLNDNGTDIRLTYENGTQMARDVEFYSTNGSIFFSANTSDTGFWFYGGNPSATEPAADSAYGSEAVYSSAYDAVYHMNGLVDSTSNSRTGTIMGTVTQEDGTYGKEYDFQGSSDYIYAPTGITSYPFTLTILMNLDTVSNYDDYLFLADWGTSYVLGTMDYAQSPRKYTMYARDASTSDLAHGSTTVQTGIPQLIDIVFRSAADRELYLNGSSEITDSTSISFTAGIDRLLIGQRRSEDTGTLDGKVQEVRILSKSKSIGEIVTISNNLNNPTASGTYPFYNSTGTVEYFPTPTPTPTPIPTISVSSVQYDELDFPLILYILMISLLYLFIAFRHGVATIELSLIYLIFAFIFLLFQTVTMSVNYIYLTLFLLLFMISIAGITLEKRS